MKHAHLLAALFVGLSLTSASFAQKKLEDGDFVALKPTLGDAFPDIAVYSPDGKTVRPADWKGHYTVLTFGCLT